MAAGNAFDSASIELYARLWDELERLGPESPAMLERLEIVRLELLLVVDLCGRKSGAGAPFDEQQRASLRSLAQRVLHEIGPEERACPEGVAAAQNLLLDAVLARGAGSPGLSSAMRLRRVASR